MAGRRGAVTSGREQGSPGTGPPPPPPPCPQREGAGLGKGGAGHDLWTFGSLVRFYDS